MSAVLSRHAARESLAVRIAVPAGVLFTAMASLATLLGIPPSEASERAALPAPAAAMALPTVEVVAEPAMDPCVDDAVVTALAAGDDAATVQAFGGGAEFQAAVVSGNAPCISLDDPHRTWVVVNKQRPLQPEHYAPASLAAIGLQATSRSNELRPEATAALEVMAAAAAEAGAGTIGINNGYRSFDVQTRTYGSHVRNKGQEGADAVSARPGFSEHQSGLAFDLIACSSRCGSHEVFGDTSQGSWVAENAWRHGFIVRYESGKTGTTGYAPEPWHIRYIGEQLAAAYHEGGFHSLEEFFGLPAAPDYVH
ncbi:M15 family metallopeptidase [Microbacterium sp. H1-D42]|uniref:M15 family metallopeptidase n=1 Tax=Microbacterium sp. H1-D42 TaxID=2925844 RepID=UPI001F53111F|nr:M15 family metallopeptidase [Microbacterium sp. H1-D42]UNK70505.1 M15 family metallopeptidase [Microbacterium sp. H1-D42]